MSTTTFTPALRAATGLVRPHVRRPVRQPASARGPVARPLRPVPPPSVGSGLRSAVRSCQLDGAASAGRWRLTDRGIAVVLVLAVMITVAAVTVIGLTAWQVTGADYRSVTGPAGAPVSAR